MLAELQAIDLALFKLIHIGLKNVFLDILCPLLRNKLFWTPLYILLFFYLYKNFERAFIIRYLIISILLIICSDFICAHFLKELFHRIRPCAQGDLYFMVQPLIHCSATFSMPSCHATNHFALSIFFINTQFKSYKLFFLLWAGIIGISQVYVGVHYPFDIIIGAILGSLLGYVFSEIFKFISKK